MSYPFAEHELAVELGLSHAVLKKIRKEYLDAGADWLLVDGAVRYSPEGRAALLATLNVKVEAPVAPAQPEPVIADLIVSKRYTLNTRVVEAKYGDKTVRVRMRTNVNMRPGMVMKCRLVANDMWDLVQRLPRWPGKW